jgi:transposase
LVGLQGLAEAKRRETTVSQDIILTVDYHDENCVIRRFDVQSGQEQLLKVPTDAEHLLTIVERARGLAQARGGRVIWVMESTTGWARVKTLLGRQVRFVLANVVQMPLPPKARRKKTDKIDTARLQREYRNGELPQASGLPAWWRQARRLVALRENLVSRQTALRNWINRYLAHETWAARTNLWSIKGRAALQPLVEQLPVWDRLVVGSKLSELDLLQSQKTAVEKEMHRLCQRWPRAQRLAQIDGIGIISAVSIAARIGPVQRFARVEDLIGYAGLAPGVRQSDQTRWDGRLGGPGTDRHLRHYLIEATMWARRIPRYRDAYERTVQRRGKKIGRVVVARMLLRSIYRMLRKGEAFVAAMAAEVTC